MVDTHVMLWHLEDDSRLAWSKALEDPSNERYFSIASLWEIAIKTNIGKLKIKYPLDQLIPAEFQLLPISVQHLVAYQILPQYHRDRNDGPAI